MAINPFDKTSFEIGAWLSKPNALIQFIAERRIDASNPVWVWKRIFIYSILASIVTILLMVFVDPLYLNYLENRKSSGHIFFQKMTKLGEAAWWLVPSGVLILSMQIVSGDKFKGHLRAVWHRTFFTVWFVFYSVGLSGILALIFKFVVSRARPQFVIGDDPWYFEPFTLGYNVESFPSGHATTMGACIVALCLLLKSYRWLIIPVGLLIACTRVVIGAHFPSDVMAGLFLGSMFTWIYARSMAKHRLLFAFADDGRLNLRNEGKGYYNYIPAMFVQGFGGPKVMPVKKRS